MGNIYTIFATILIKKVGPKHNAIFFGLKVDIYWLLETSLCKEILIHCYEMLLQAILFYKIVSNNLTQ